MSTDRIRITLSPSHDRIWIRNVTEPGDVVRARLIPGRKWLPLPKVWECAINEDTLAVLRARFPHADVTEAVSGAVAERAERLHQARRIKDDGAPDDLVLPVKSKPYAHQLAAAAVALKILVG